MIYLMQFTRKVLRGSTIKNNYLHYPDLEKAIVSKELQKGNIWYQSF